MCANYTAQKIVICLVYATNIYLESSATSIRPNQLITTNPYLTLEALNMKISIHGSYSGGFGLSFFGHNGFAAHGTLICKHPDETKFNLNSCEVCVTSDHA